ncbi:MAG: acetolactate synthase large subunit [Acidimicrobiia bacterium]|jgi:acetolactate synthase-1/2/3 large subunit|nr:acetolactate synthase large subunit [Actinomycetota bacterium]NDE58690.1 acetolactate synthase large subunit [Acidimicrobiia bacterium]NDD96615.1 acetolactate synthase large subunit [Actinomycetota bacterium]NDE80508.1 acetolactate synthase large subunit [Actinomycetota bacterium]NDF31441.1 acetolactate synthase large subunit [Acidimicrobiia bacterium]
MTQKITGAQALIRALELENVDTIFGLPGGCILPAYDPLLDSPIRHILVRHEQGAGHMAEGYAHVTGRPGVAMVTSGPAATNMVTPLCDAYMDSIPMVCITGQVPTTAIGTDAFQECDTVGITRSVTKHNELIMSADDVPLMVRQAFHIATTGRPGPVLLDLPKDVLQNSMTWHWPSDEEVLDSLPGYKPVSKGHPRMIKEAARMILDAKQPIIYAGGGILKARAADALRELAELIDTPVVTTLMARGAFPDDHPLCLGMPGMHGNATAITAMQKSDLLITLGARFDDRITGKVATFAPDAKIIHVDIDPAEQGKVRRPDVPIVGDCRLVIEEIIKAIKDLLNGGDKQQDISAWKSRVSGWREQFPLYYPSNEPGEALKPQYCLEQLRDGAPEGTILCSGVGQHQMWSSQYWKFNEPYTWVNSGGLGTMGFSVPAAIGAKVGRPDRTVWAVDGDGCFQMTAQELVTASVERIPIKVAILNNSYLGMVRQWQEMFYEERYSEVYLSPELPDFVKWAESMGCIGIRVESPEEVQPAIEKANSIDDRSVVVEFRVDAGEKVFPMVPAGFSNDDVLLHPDQNNRREFLR